MGTARAAELEPRTLSFEDRVAAQKAIEQVYWNHRIWPKENTQPKPPLSVVMSDGAIRAKTEDYLKKSNALETWWRRPITSQQFQAEIDRMSTSTRNGAMLLELYQALGNDPFLVAETLARQTLVERLIHSWYASDPRFHGELKRQTEAAVAACRNVGCMKSMGAEYRETTWRRRGSEAVGSTTDLDDEAWKDHLQRLAQRLGGVADALPANRLGSLEETAESYSVVAVIAQGRDEVTTASVVWMKKPFDAWWGEQRATQSAAVSPVNGTFSLRQPATTDPASNSWTPLYEWLEPRISHTAVWTGTEMIVWGGYYDDLLNTGGRYNPSTDSWTPTSTGANTPDARGDHTAVWTGTEMIIWAGVNADGSSYYNSGGRYNPSTDSWVPTSTGLNVPEARQGHTAVWTGTEMIIWGGYWFPPFSQPVYFVTGGRYDPVSDSWVRTATTGAPTARSGFTSVWTGAEMIVWGGSGTTQYLNSGGRYRPSTDTWSATNNDATAPAGRYEHTAIWTGAEMIVDGGLTATSFNSGGRYNPSSDSWVPTSGARSASSWLSAVWTGTEMIIWGGPSGGSRYNPGTDSWTGTGSGGLTRRYGHTAVWTGTEMIIWGGSFANNSGEPSNRFNSGGRYNPTTGAWVIMSAASNVPAGRSNHTAVWTGAEMIVWGGTDYWNYFNTGGLYNPSTNSWTATRTDATTPSQRAGHSAVWTGREMIVWGGDRFGINYWTTGGRYAPSDNSWAATGTGTGVPTARSYQTAVWTGTEMVIWGGYWRSGNTYQYFDTGGSYNPDNDTWRPTSTGANVPDGRAGHTALWTGTRMIVWGGNNNAASWLASGSRYDPSTDSWTPATSVGAPAARTSHSAVWTGTEMIVWGGRGPFPSFGSGTGGRYDPSTDSWVATSIGPPDPATRYSHTAVWTGATMVIWGGQNGGGSLNAGGSYDPFSNSWEPTAELNAPSARYGQTAIWTGDEMMVWGGISTASLNQRIYLCNGGRYSAAGCATPTILYQDSDGDEFGNLSISRTGCAGMSSWTTQSGDCDDSHADIHPGAPEICNGMDDNCNGLIDEDALGVDSDGDGVRNACDVCAAAFDPAQSDFDHDGQGDLCDVNDGLIYLLSTDKIHIAWQGESGPASFNVYEGDLDLLRASGVYTQVPGSNPLANKRCGVTDLSVLDAASVPSGKVKFALVTGVTGGVEGSLGTDGGNVERPNTNPCP